MVVSANKHCLMRLEIHATFGFRTERYWSTRPQADCCPPVGLPPARNGGGLCYGIQSCPSRNHPGSNRRRGMSLAQCDLDDRVRKALDLFVPGRGIPNCKVRDVARRVGISSSQLTRLFWQEVGQSPCKVRKALFLKEAKRLLLTTRLTVKQVAYGAGFQYASNFVKDFEAAYGLSPKEYRKAASSSSNQTSWQLEHKCENLPTK